MSRGGHLQGICLNQDRFNPFRLRSEGPKDGSARQMGRDGFGQESGVEIGVCWGDITGFGLGFIPRLKGRLEILDHFPLFNEMLQVGDAIGVALHDTGKISAQGIIRAEKFVDPGF